MKILIYIWKDKQNPFAGGSEIVIEGLAKKLVADHHEVILLTTMFPGARHVENIDGYKVVRIGNRITAPFLLMRYYKNSLQGWADLVVECVNTIPFYTPFYVKEKHILFFHQLCREIWFHQMFFPLNLIGYAGEPINLYLLNKNKVITISESTKQDLIRFGFKESNIYIIPEAIEITPVSDIKTIKKYRKPTMISLGSLRAMKRTIDQVKAFEIAKKQIPQLKLIIAGGGGERGYDKKFHTVLENSRYKQDIAYLGRVGEKKKIELLQRSHIITVTSVKEGWGLIVTEANSQGTPAVVYNVDGLRDSVQQLKTGIITRTNTPPYIAREVVRILKKKSLYEKLRINAWEMSKQISFDSSYNEFKKILYML